MLELAIGVLTDIALEAGRENLNRQETIVRVLKKLNLSDVPSQDDFDGIYVHALIDYGVFKPQPILNLFRHRYVRSAFRDAFYQGDPQILEREVDGILEWNRETGELGAVGSDVRAELREFSEAFRTIVLTTRSAAEVLRDRQQAEIHRMLTELYRDRPTVPAKQLEGGVEPLTRRAASVEPISQEQIEWSRGALVYEIDLVDPKRAPASLSEWEFVTTSQTWPKVAVANGILGLGANDGTTFNRAPVVPLADVSFDCELSIVDDGGNHDNWAGIRVRGLDFYHDIRLGYLVYLTRRGTVELYGPEGIIAGAGDVVIPNLADTWVSLRADVLGAEIRVYVNQRLHFRAQDKTFGGKGRVFLHTFGTHTQFRSFKVFELNRVR